MIGIGLDIGGGSIKGGLFDENGEILYETSFSTYRSMQNSEFAHGLKQVLDPVLNYAKYEFREIPVGVGIGSPGPIESEKGIIYASANLPQLDSFPIVEYLRETYNLESVISNDANSAAIGEYYFGKAKGSPNLFVFTLGTGLGGGWVWNGKLFKGYAGNGMEIGHTTIVKDGALCSCGKRGCAEAYFSATGLLNRYEEKTGFRLTDVAELFTQARTGNSPALETIEAGTDALAEAGRTIVNLLNVDTIVFVGGLTKSWDLFSERLTQGIRLKSFPVLAERLQIFVGENKAILGAGALLLEHLELRKEKAKHL